MIGYATVPNIAAVSGAYLSGSSYTMGSLLLAIGNAYFDG